MSFSHSLLVLMREFITVHWICNSKMANGTKYIYKLGVRMRMMPRAAPCAMRGAGVRGCSFSIVGAQRTVQNNGNVKSEPKYLACEESPVRAFYCWTLSCSLLALLWTDLFVFFFVRVASRRLRSVLASALDSAKYVRCEGPAALSSRPPSRKTSSRRRRVMHVVSDSYILPGRDLKLTFLSGTANWHS